MSDVPPEARLATRVAALFGRAVEVRAGEARALGWSFAYFFFLLCGYYVLRPIRDEMGIAAGVAHLQWLFTATFVVMLAAVPVFGFVVARLARRRFVPLVYRFFIANLAVFFLAFSVDEWTVWVARAFFVWVSVFNLFAVSVFWSVMADSFRNEQGRRLFGFIAAGGTAGALLGPALTALLAAPLGPKNLLPVSAVLLEAAVFCVARLAGAAQSGARVSAAAPAADPADSVIGGGLLAGLAETVRSPYLLAIALYLILSSLTSTFLYFQQAHAVAAAFEDAGERTRLFALIDFAVNGATVLIQVFVTARFVRRFGTGGALSLAPLVTAVGFLGLAAFPGVGLVVGLLALRRAAHFAISNPAREVLFTVVGREAKYKAKNFIDTAVYRGADAASGWAHAGLAQLGLSLPAVALAAVPLAALWLALAVALGRREARLAASQATMGADRIG